MSNTVVDKLKELLSSLTGKPKSEYKCNTVVEILDCFNKDLPQSAGGGASSGGGAFVVHFDIVDVETDEVSMRESVDDFVKAVMEGKQIIGIYDDGIYCTRIGEDTFLLFKLGASDSKGDFCSYKFLTVNMDGSVTVDDETELRKPVW